MSTDSWWNRQAWPDHFRPILKRSAEMDAAALESYVAPRGTVARLIAERDAARADTACLRAALDAMTQERDAAVAALDAMRDRLPAGERDRTPTPTPGPRDQAGCLFSIVRDTTGWGSLG